MLPQIRKCRKSTRKESNDNWNCMRLCIITFPPLPHCSLPSFLLLHPTVVIAPAVPMPQDSSPSPSTDGPTRDLNGAREAYAKKDVNASKLYHSLKTTTASTAGAETGHQIGEGIALKHNLCNSACVGILAQCLLLSTGSSFLPASDLAVHVMARYLISGAVTTALVGGIALYIHNRRYKAHYHREREREEWELDSYKDGEILEMVELYESKGMTQADATAVIRTMANYPKFFVDVMMVEELEMKAPTAFGVYEMFLCILVSLASSLTVSSPFWLLSTVAATTTEPSIQSFAALENLTTAVYFLALVGFGTYKSKLDHNADFRSFFEIVVMGIACVGVPRLVATYTL
jgi:hypothetical protein